MWAHSMATVARALLAFGGLILAAKAIGQPWTVVTGVAVASLAAGLAVFHAIPIGDFLLAMAAWAGAAVAVQKLSVRLLSVRSFLQGTATVLVQRGKVLDNNLRTANLTVENMMTLLREKNAFKLSDVETAVLEPDGQVTVMLKTDSQPVTPTTLHLTMASEPAPHVVVLDGQVMADGLADAGKERPWLLEEIRKQGANSLSDVFLAQVDGQGQLYVDLFNDRVNAPPTRLANRPLLLAQLKQLEADLESFALQTKDVAAKAGYAEGARMLTSVINRTRIYLEK
ncbi:DUF421 domain-containing protein [Alicyclobacillaceae bacterium I2511]|nr:DUF421 domain-containing protein [Alicyclobacillaceae bacterium I2511]